MNVFENLTRLLEGLLSFLPEILRPVAVALAGAIPFVEGELAAVLGVWAGLNPVVAGAAAASGNFLCVLVIVRLGSRIRSAVVDRRARGRETQGVTAKPESSGRLRLRRFLERYGVPGASLLGPLAIPTQFTSAILVGTGASKGWILLWQGISIALWTTAVTLIAAGAIALLAL